MYFKQNWKKIEKPSYYNLQAELSKDKLSFINNKWILLCGDSK